MARSRAADEQAVQRDEQAAARDEQAKQLASAICGSVLRKLGRPDRLFRISAIRLWTNHFRVNVQTGADATSTRIEHSFFVSAGEDGSVLESIPPIARCY
jgi:hypothetical protein